MISGLVEELILFAGKMGYLGIVLIVGLEYACLPIPSEVVLPFVGMSVAIGEFGYLGALLVSIIGGIVGSWICYIIGCIGGVPLLEWSSVRWPKTKKTIDALNKWFNRYGNIAVLLTRLFPLTRTYISILAGAQKLNFFTFTAYSVIGITIWNTVLISLGYYLGDNLDLVEKILSRYSALIIGIGVIGIIVFVLKKRIVYIRSK